MNKLLASLFWYREFVHFCWKENPNTIDQQSIQQWQKHKRQPECNKSMTRGGYFFICCTNAHALISSSVDLICVLLAYRPCTSNLYAGYCGNLKSHFQWIINRLKWDSGGQWASIVPQTASKGMWLSRMTQCSASDRQCIWYYWMTSGRVGTHSEPHMHTTCLCALASMPLIRHPSIWMQNQIQFSAHLSIDLGHLACVIRR